ncbi:uncharacterized protein LOC109842244 [Asparagus officinalis]|uniref:uncharacterized protein LOC109842244 n=1 Tax=Asparagus officinalis TaxID=4686 RepID=UPI00098E369C|nr:uncharacterized protein LOC109842244 [Asparagus officinalis]
MLFSIASQPVRDLFKKNADAKKLLEKVKAYRVTRSVDCNIFMMGYIYSIINGTHSFIHSTEYELLGGKIAIAFVSEKSKNLLENIVIIVHVVIMNTLVSELNVD